MLHQAFVRITLAAFLGVACLGAAGAETVKEADATALFDKYCHEWGAALKQIAAKAGNDAQRTADINEANKKILQKLKSVKIFPLEPIKTLSDAKKVSREAKEAQLNACLESEASAAFGQGTRTTATVRLIMNVSVSASEGNDMTVSERSTIQVSPATHLLTTNLLQAFGKQWGDHCLSKGPACCTAPERVSGYSEYCKSAEACRLPARICNEMVTCNARLGDCKKREMAKDPRCDGAACRKCTSDYATCSGAATKISS